MKILFLIPYPPGVAPSQRFRFEQYLQLLAEKGFHSDVQSFLNNEDWKLFFRQGEFFRKILILISGFFRRVAILFKVNNYAFIFIHREAMPIGPPIIEWVVSKVLKKRIIYDFDDAIWLTDRKNESFFLTGVRWRSKVRKICEWSHKVSCGNEYLRQFALKYNSNAFLNPTTIDTQHLHNPEKYQKIPSEKVIIGWTGSHSTLKYLNELEPLLQTLERRYPHLEYWVIADQPPALNLKNLKFKKWTLESEIVNLSQFDIGIMPLPDDDWAKGKCGFKALQYMALNIPTIVSPIGVNKEIIQDRKNGFSCKGLKEWESRLIELIENFTLRNSIGREARKTVVEQYSVSSNTKNFLSLFS